MVRHRVFTGINVPLLASFIVHSLCCTPQTQGWLCCVFLTAVVRESDHHLTRVTQRRLVAIRLKRKQVTKRGSELSFGNLVVSLTRTGTHTWARWSWSDMRPATGSGSQHKHSLAKHDLLTQWERSQSPRAVAGYPAEFGIKLGRDLLKMSKSFQMVQFRVPLIAFSPIRCTVISISPELVFFLWVP